MNLDLDLLFTNPLYIIKKKFRDQIRKYGNQITGLTLDVGCGKRPFVKFIASERYVGLEQNVRLKPDVVSNAAYLPFRDGVFDSLLCTEVLEHVPEPKQVIEEISRVLKEGGKVYITTPMM
jgi:SAM-dependent methyltransferase